MTSAAPVADMAQSADLGSTIDEAFDEAVSPETPVEATPEPEVVEAQTAESTTPEASAPPAEAAKTIDGYQVDAAGNYIVPKVELPQLQAAKQYADAVMQKFPTPQDAEIAYAQSSDFQAMMNDMQYGADSDVDAMLNFFSGGNAQDPQVKAAMKAGFERMAVRSSDLLAKLNPEAHSKHVSGLMEKHVDNLYKKWQQSGSEDDKAAYQRASWGHSGQYKTEVTRIDPAQQQAEQLAAQRQEMEARETQLLDRDWSSYNKSTVDGPRWDQFNSEIDTALKTVKDAYTPAVYGALRKDIAAQLLEKMQGDYEFARTQNITRTQIQKGYEQAWKSRQGTDALNPRIQSYQANFMAKTRQLLPSIAKSLINQAAAPKAAARTQPQPNPQNQNQPTRAANGQYTQPKHAQKLTEDPEFAGMFS